MYHIMYTVIIVTLYRPSSDHSQRLSDAQTLLSDLLTPSPVALNNRNLPVSRSTLSNAMKTMTLSCTVPRNSSSHMTLGSSHVTSLDDTTRTRVDVQPRGQLKVNKRRLSSIECLSEAEQIKITEMLQVRGILRTICMYLQCFLFYRKRLKTELRGNLIQALSQASIGVK